MPDFVLATEDILSEEVGLRLISELGEGFHVSLKLRRNGNGYLKSRIESLFQLAERNLVLLITDLDQDACPASLISVWLPSRVKPRNLLFRVAVREIEAWLIADHEGMLDLLGRKVTKLSDNPDLLADAKQTLLQYAQRAPRSVRDDLLPAKNAVAVTGLGYNRCLTEFVRDRWSPTRAAARSESLRRARARIRDLAVAD